MLTVKTNYHQHTTWCDGRDGVEAMILAAIDRAFDEIGFSSHARLPTIEPGNLTPATAEGYAREVRELGRKYAPRISVRLGVEADYVAGETTPERGRYAGLGVEYVIGSVHWVRAGDGGLVCVDDTPERLAEGVALHFGGDARAFVRAYFAQEREMALAFDFDVIGHPDLVRKFNGALALFDEADDWYREELHLAADAFAASGKIVEVNTGAIARGWMDDAYPSPEFRRLLRERGARFLLGSDAHSVDQLDCAFERFAPQERFLPFLPLAFPR